MVFGYELRASCFQFDDEVVNLNHGSYGACPREVLDARIEGMRNELAFPDMFYRVKHQEVTNKAREIFAKELDAPLDNVVCVTNATLGMNVAFKALAETCETHCHVVFFSTIYGNTRNLLQHLAEVHNWQLDEIHLPLDIESPQQILDIFHGHLIKLLPCLPVVAVIETVSSMPSIRFPWEEMVAICDKRLVYSIVDGAHGLGLIPISLSKVKPGFFVTNAHKWYYAAHSVAALYARDSLSKSTTSMPIGVQYTSRNDLRKHPEKWHDMFDNVGTSDRSAIYAIPAAAKFREEELGGMAKALEYQNSLASELSRYLCEEWTTTEVGYFGEEYRTALVTLRCPFQPEDKQGFVQFAYTHMMEVHHTLIPLFVYDNTVLLRFSAAVYMELEDFKHGKRVLDATIEEWKRLHPGT